MKDLNLRTWFPAVSTFFGQADNIPIYKPNRGPLVLSFIKSKSLRRINRKKEENKGRGKRGDVGEDIEREVLGNERMV
ncbi:hypothetical protein RRG08_020837 [Elysia crispata]|uniref:Uncharacterized protein n=1 Tax=Elysia crispata TaxID=231223 RepID=A0AAE0XV68_9GAST|nr:hypothetical protein RRG08_020837 [Elysia crispata]